MKALSVKNPWAWAIAHGFKTIETRTWATNYRGPLLIVSSLKPDRILLDWFIKETGQHIENQIEYGKAIAVVDLLDCRPMTKADQDAALCDVYSGAVSWVLENVRPIESFPQKGQLGLYNVDYEI
jgi:hypothetical protein